MDFQRDLHHLPKPFHRLGRLAWREMTIGVHGQCDLRVPHDGLDYLGMFTGQSQPRTTGMPQAVKIKALAFVVGR